MERGNTLKRTLDEWVGIPLVVMLGGARRLSGLVTTSKPTPGETRRVGILCLGAIGDLLLATSLTDGIRKVLPVASLEVITSQANTAALALLPPEFRKASFPVSDVWAITRHVRAARYDLLFDLGQWARISSLVCAVSGAGRTVGFATPGQHRHCTYDHAVPHRDDRHETENFLALGRALFPDLAGEPSVKLPEAPSETCPELPAKGVVFCHMWPSGRLSHLKEWPGAFWKELALELLASGYSPVFTGGPQDAGRTAAFLESCGWAHDGPALSVAGRISLPDLAWHFARAEAVVSVNTGTMHLAALSGAPTVGLHGPTNPLRWGPVGPKTASLLPRAGHSAYLNLGFEYPPDADMVLRHLPVEDVLAALREFGLTL